MTAFDGAFAEPEPRRVRMERLSHAANDTSEVARRYLAVRRQSERGIPAHRDLLAAAAERDKLRAAVAEYVRILRDEGTPRDLAVRLVKDMLEPVDPRFGMTDSNLLDALERWVLEAYRAT